MVKVNRDHDTTAEYKALAAMLRDTKRRLDVAQMMTATQADGKSVRFAIQQTHEALVAASHQAKRIK